MHAAGYSKPRSLSMAYLMAARSHFASARPGRGLLCVSRAWRLAPTRMLDGLAWRILVGGLLRRPVYLLRAIVKRRAS